MTDDETAEQIERSRRRREKELVALLLLLLGELLRELVTLFRYGNVIEPAIARILGNAVPVIATHMADAHADAFGRFGRLYDPGIGRRDAGSRSDVARVYAAPARDMAQAMAVSLYNAIVAASSAPVPADATAKQAARWGSPEAIVRRAMDASGYARTNPVNLELGVERRHVRGGAEPNGRDFRNRASQRNRRARNGHLPRA